MMKKVEEMMGGMQMKGEREGAAGSSRRTTREDHQVGRGDDARDHGLHNDEASNRKNKSQRLQQKQRQVSRT
jgi:hypothetical protein